MVAKDALVELMLAIGGRDASTTARLLDTSPELVTAGLDRSAEFFLDECSAQMYAGDTALHAAAGAFDVAVARQLIEAGADVRAQDRRGAEPLHLATRGGPGSTNWDPDRQVAMIAYLIEVGADPNAPAYGGVTPLHRAVRNRCSAAVQALLAAGADPRRSNDKGSTARDLAGWTTGRGGTGSPAAKLEQQRIVEMLEAAGA